MLSSDTGLGWLLFEAWVSGLMLCQERVQPGSNALVSIPAQELICNCHGRSVDTPIRLDITGCMARRSGGSHPMTVSATNSTQFSRHQSLEQSRRTRRQLGIGRGGIEWQIYLCGAIPPHEHRCHGSGL
jgi:hypothetical protein